MADHPTPPDDFTVTDLAPMHERIQRVVEWVSTATHSTPEPISERHFLYGDAPHPATHAHTQAVVDRIHALTPTPSLVKLDRGEALVAQVVAWRNLELGGQAPGDQQWDAALAYVRDLTDKYTEAAS